MITTEFLRELQTKVNCKKYILEIKIANIEIELEKEELEMFKKIKKFYLNKIFN